MRKMNSADGTIGSTQPSGVFDDTSSPTSPRSGAADPSRDRVFHSLDALRGIAATGVVALHFDIFFAPLAVPGGYLAVDLFFIMSGVVIAHAYDRRFQIGMTAWQFMRARLIRLYPLYLLGTAIGVVATAASMFGNNLDHWDSKSLLFAIIFGVLFIPDFYGRPNTRLFPLNAPCWSLFFEILINLAFGVLWPRLSVRGLLLVNLLSAIGVACFVWAWGHIDQGYTFSSFPAGVVRTIFGFSAGVLIARTTATSPRRKSAAGFLAICAVVIVVIVGWPQGAHRAFWDAASVLLVFPAVVYAGTIFDPPDWLKPAATFLGLTSYATYVVHGPLSTAIHSILRLLLRGSPAIGAPYSGMALIALLLMISWVTDKFFDSPLRRALNRSKRSRKVALA
jgi:peptidoglycan/LPS O-acetylase OafA/YrhL